VSIAQTFRSSITLQAAFAAAKRHFAYAGLFSALLNILFIAPMLYMLQVYDRVVPTQGRTTLLFLTLILIIALGTLAALEAIRSRLLVRASVQIDLALAGPIMRATLLQPDSGQRLARQAVREFDTFRQALTGPAMLGLLDAPWVPVYLLIAFLIHPWIGVLTLSGALIIVFLAWRTEVANRARL
jgi:ATP-binding cassette subfamily C protein